MSPTNNDEQVKVNFMAEKEHLVTQYRYAVEQALAKAEFLTSSDIVTLQAFVLYIVLIRRHDDTRLGWTMTGLAIRICQSLGLHRDGSNFSNLTPFEVEMRRRLFWALCIIDLRAAEDQGTDLTLVDRSYDTQTPLNINDSDIGPDSQSFPPAREGTTDMTFSLIRYEICTVARRLHAMNTANGSLCPGDAATTFADRERMIQEAYERVERKYLKDSSAESDPIYWVAANIARVICAKMTIIIYQPLLLPSPTGELSGDIRDRLLTSATEIFEYNHLLNTDPRTKQWRWLIQTYTQWHAVAYVLLEVARRPWSATVERSWAALTSIFANPHCQELEKMAEKSAIWMPFRKLYAKARKHREAEIQRLRDHPEAAIRLDAEDRSHCLPPTFVTMPGSIRNAISQERWRKLVGAPPLPADTADPQPDPQPGRRSATAGGARAPPPAALNPPAMNHTSNDLLNSVFSQPTFTPSDLFPIAFGNDSDLRAAHEEATRAALFGGLSNGQVPRVDDTLGLYSQNGGSSSSGATAPSMPTAAAVNSYLKDNPPPWLWGRSNEQNTQAGQVSGMPIEADDVDVNMDENFDWQNFGESLKGFEMENGGMAGGVWFSQGY